MSSMDKGDYCFLSPSLTIIHFYKYSKQDHNIFSNEIKKHQVILDSENSNLMILTHNTVAEETAGLSPARNGWCKHTCLGESRVKEH